MTVKRQETNGSLSVVLFGECRAERSQRPAPRIALVMMMRGTRELVISLTQHFPRVLHPSFFPHLSFYRCSFRRWIIINFLPPAVCFNLFAAGLGSSWRCLSPVTNQRVGVRLLLQNLEWKPFQTQHKQPLPAAWPQVFLSTAITPRLFFTLNS